MIKVTDTKSWAEKMIKRICILTILAWSGFLFFDGKMESLREDRMETGSTTYPEIYGPVSYFTPKFKYIAFTLTVALAYLSWRQASRTQPVRVDNRSNVKK